MALPNARSLATLGGGRCLPVDRILLAVFFAMVVVLDLPDGGAAIAQPVTSCLAEPNDTAISYGAAVACQIDAAGDSDVFRFVGSADDVIYVGLLGQGSF